MKHFAGETAVAAIFLGLLFVLLNPWNIFMPDYVEMGIIAALVFFFGIFANFIWREGGGDERERFHSMFADRIAFLVGSGALLVAVIVGELAGAGPDLWVLFALAAMVAAKVAALVYTRIRL